MKGYGQRKDEMKITIHDPPEGFEAEAEFRAPKKGESVLGNSGTHWVANCYYAVPHIVLTPKWTPPRWLLELFPWAEWIARDSVGAWSVYESDPYWTGYYWTYSSGTRHAIIPRHADFTPPKYNGVIENSKRRLR